MRLFICFRMCRFSVTIVTSSTFGSREIPPWCYAASTPRKRACWMQRREYTLNLDWQGYVGRGPYSRKILGLKTTLSSPITMATIVSSVVKFNLGLKTFLEAGPHRNTSSIFITGLILLGYSQWRVHCTFMLWRFFLTSMKYILSLKSVLIYFMNYIMNK